MTSSGRIATPSQCLVAKQQSCVSDTLRTRRYKKCIGKFVGMHSRCVLSIYVPMNLVGQLVNVHSLPINVNNIHKHLSEFPSSKLHHKKNVQKNADIFTH